MVDRSPVQVTFRGRRLEVRPSETLLAALSRRGLPLLQRSIRYHRPRAPFCGEGFCTQCLVRVNGVPNVRACRYLPRAGDRITTENSWPSPAFDLFGVIDDLFPHGIDVLRGFRRPAFARPLYQRLVRRMAGYGELPDATPAPPAPAERLTTGVLVIGAGAAGRAASQRAAIQGAPTLLIDRGELPAPPEGVEARSGLTAVFLPAPVPGASRPFELLATEGDRTVSIAAEKVVLATGAYDANLLFPGNDRPGVMTAEGALAMRSSSGDPPFRQALLVGGTARTIEMIDRFGPRIAAVVAPGTVHGRIAEQAVALGIPVFPRTLVVGANGRRRVRSVELRGRSDGSVHRLSVDAIVFAHRRLPHTQLFFQVGARMHWRGGGGAYYPTLDEGLRTTVPGIWAAGEVAGFRDPTGIEASGIAAGESALGHAVSMSALPARVPEVGPHELEGYYRELLRGHRTSGKCVACPCEDVLLTELTDAHERGYRGVEVIKRYTSLGTGFCQGRYCLSESLLLLSLWEGRPPAEVGYITQRPPVVPVTLGALSQLPAEPEGSGS
jgi:sarcosine oxidase subunit alpha